MGENKKFKVVQFIKNFWHTPPKGRFLNMKEILCLGSASLGVSFIVNIVNLYITITQIPKIYDLGTSGTLHATIIYIAAGAAGLILTPLWGKWIQKTKSKMGRYKPYILFLAPVVSLFMVLAVWSPNSLDTLQARIIYVYVTCIPALLLWNIWFNTFNLFPGVITPNHQERVDIWSPIGLVMGLAPTIMNAVKGIFVKFWGDVGAARILGLVSAISGVLMVLAIIKVKERVFITDTEEKKEKVSVWQGLSIVFRNKPLMILTLAFMCAGLKGAIDFAWDFVAAVKYADNMADAALILGGTTLIIGFAATPNMALLPWLTRKFNSRTIMIFWQALHSGAYIILGFVGFENLPQGSWSVVIITVVRFMACFNAIGSLQPLMLAEIGDLNQAKSGYRLEGFTQTFAYSVVMLVSQALMLIPAFIQDKMGFNPNDYLVIKNTPNIASPEAVLRLESYANVAIWISVASGLMFIFFMCFYGLSKKRHAQIMAEIKSDSVNTDEVESDAGSVSLIESSKVTVEDDENGENSNGDEKINDDTTAHIQAARAGKDADNSTGGTDDTSTKV